MYFSIVGFFFGEFFDRLLPLFLGGQLDAVFWPVVFLGRDVALVLCVIGGLVILNWCVVNCGLLFLLWWPFVFIVVVL